MTPETPRDLFTNQLASILENVKDKDKSAAQAAIFKFLEQDIEYPDFVELLEQSLRGLVIYTESIRDTCDIAGQQDLKEITVESLAILNQIRVLIDTIKVLNGLDL
jgi:FPC/CPF motif-containing protein YcgG